MAFHLTSRSISLQDGSLLQADCRDREGRYHESTLDLDRCLGNSDGAFEWGGVNFSKSARNIILTFPLLSAQLRDCNGRWHSAEVDLGQRIENINGAMRYEWGGAVGSALDEVGNDIQRHIFDPLERTMSSIFGFGGHEDHHEAEPGHEMSDSTRTVGRAEQEHEPAADERREPAPAKATPDSPHRIVMEDLGQLTATGIGERLLSFLLQQDGTARPGETARTVRAFKGPDGAFVLEFDAERYRAEAHLPEDRVQRLQAERLFFDADDHMQEPAKAEDGAHGSKSAPAQELDGQKESKVRADKDEDAELRHEVESIDIESHLDTPDFSDGEDEWLVAKTK